MQRRTITILSALAVVLAVAGGILWYRAEAYDDLMADCGRALAARSDTGEAGKPAACDGVKARDYRGLVLKNIFDNMSPEGRDTVDWLTED